MLNERKGKTSGWDLSGHSVAVVNAGTHTVYNSYYRYALTYAGTFGLAMVIPRALCRFRGTPFDPALNRTLR